MRYPRYQTGGSVDSDNPFFKLDPPSRKTAPAADDNPFFKLDPPSRKTGIATGSAGYGGAEPPPGTIATRYDWSEVPEAALSNIGPNALKVGSDVVESVQPENAVSTVKGLLGLAGAPITVPALGVAKAIDWAFPGRISKRMVATAQEYADPALQFSQELINKYGGGPEIRRTLAERPVEAALDASMIVPLIRAIRGGPRIRPTPDAVIAGNQSLAAEAGITPTRGMLTGDRKLLEIEDKMRHGAHGARAEAAMAAGDEARIAGLDKATGVVRAELSGSLEPLSRTAVGETLTERINAANDTARATVRQAYDDAFDPARLTERGIDLHVPEDILTTTGEQVRNAMMGDRPFVATIEAAPNTAAALRIIDDFARSGRVRTVAGDPMPAPGSTGASWQSVDQVRQQLNGLRESARNNPVDMAGVRRVLDAFDDHIGKANPLLNEARALHRERLQAFDPSRNSAAAGLNGLMKAAANTENMGLTLYNKLFESTYFKRGEGVQHIDHLMRVLSEDPAAVAALKEGALDRLFTDPKTFESLSPQRTVTMIDEALSGPRAAIYQRLFTPDELQRLQRHRDALDLVASGSTVRNPSRTSYSQIAENRRGRYGALGAAAGAAAGHALGLPGFAGEALGAGLGATTAPLVGHFPDVYAGVRARRANQPLPEPRGALRAQMPPADPPISSVWALLQAERARERERGTEARGYARGGAARSYANGGAMIPGSEQSAFGPGLPPAFGAPQRVQQTAESSGFPKLPEPPPMDDSPAPAPLDLAGLLGRIAKTMRKEDAEKDDLLLKARLREAGVGMPAGAPAEAAGVGSAPPGSDTSAVSGGPPGFTTALNITLGHEGGYNARDANGAPVNMGINQQYHPNVDVKNLTREQAAAIYKAQYWDAIDGDKLDPRIQALAFDTAVISGPARAKEFLAASGGDPAKFLALRTQFEEGLVRSNPEKYGRYANTWARRRASFGAPAAPDVQVARGGALSRLAAAA